MIEIACGRILKKSLKKVTGYSLGFSFTEVVPKTKRDFKYVSDTSYIRVFLRGIKNKIKAFLMKDVEKDISCSGLNRFY